MIKAIWGTGNWAYIASKMFDDEISCYFENDKSKIGNFLNKPVYDINDIEDKDKYYYYIPPSYFEEVKKQLEEYGLEENKNFQKIGYSCRGFKKKWIDKDLDESFNQLEEASHILSDTKKKLLFIGNLTDYEKLYGFDYLYSIAQSENLDIVFISTRFRESALKKVKYSEEKHSLQIGIPLILLNDSYIIDSLYTIKDCEKDILDIAKQIQDEISDDDLDACYEKVVYMKSYFDRLLDVFEFKCLICMDSVQPISRVIRYVANIRGKDVFYTHQGIIPGTMAIDVNGEVGESQLALHPEEFKKLIVNEQELDDAEKVISYLKESKLNRKQQPVTDMDYILERINKAHRTVFYAGQNDSRSYMVPYTEQTKRFYSHIFTSTTEGIKYLADICKRNNWNLLYKPHPMYIRDKNEALPDNVIYVKSADINDLIDLSDLVVTILSSSSYNALTRNKPVLQLGWNWLKNSGCIYEVDRIENIEDKMLEAINNGFTSEQEISFIRHVAIALKYYVYDDNTERPIRYGRPIPKEIGDLYKLYHLLND